MSIMKIIEIVVLRHKNLNQQKRELKCCKRDHNHVKHENHCNHGLIWHQVLFFYILCAARDVGEVVVIWHQVLFFYIKMKKMNVYLIVVIWHQVLFFYIEIYK